MKRQDREPKTISLFPGYATRISHVLLLLLLGVLVFVGCNKAQPSAESASSAPPSTPAAAPGPDQSPAPAANAPAVQAQAPAPSPAVTPVAPPPPPPPPPPKVYTVPSGTPLGVRLTQGLNSKTSNVGDTFVGSLAQSVQVQGVTVLKSGTPVSGTVIAARSQGKFKGEGELGIELNRVGSYRVTTQEYEQSVKGKGKRTGAMVGGGAGGGALIGGLAGGGKGALIGGLVGAGAGTAGAALTGNKGVSIPAESVITFISSSPITVTLEHKSADK
jgi:hypothetical protein